MDEPFKFLTGWSLLAAFVFKAIWDEVRLWLARRERSEQWECVKRLTDSMNRMHERNVRAWDRTNRALELLALSNLSPEVQKRALAIRDEARMDSDDSDEPVHFSEKNGGH
jgi:hypothetical protein